MKISLRNVSKQYKGKYALKDFTTELTEGVYGLLGANGVGRTTLINIFVGILGSDGGTVFSKNRKRYAACFRRSKGFP